MNTFTFTFPSFVYPTFEDKLEKLNRKLRKMTSFNEVKIISKTQEERNIYIKALNETKEILFDKVEISPPVQVKFPGYTYIGTFNFRGDVKTIYAIDDENIADLIVDPQRCDHCNTRRNRVRTHVFRKTDGSFAVIGNTCVDQYAGINIDRALSTFFNFCDLYSKGNVVELLQSENPSKEFNMELFYLNHIDRFLVAVLKTHTVYPTYMKHETWRNGTTYHISQLLENPMLEDGDFEYTVDEIKELLHKYYGHLDPTSSNFNSNLVHGLFYVNDDGSKKLRDIIVYKVRGVCAWAVYNVLNKEKENKALPQQISTTSVPNAHIGNIGETIVAEGKIQRSYEYEGKYGKCKAITIGTNKGKVVFFSSARFAKDAQVGDAIKVFGEIVEHELYKGKWKSTKIHGTKEVKN